MFWCDHRYLSFPDHIFFSYFSSLFWVARFDLPNQKHPDRKKKRIKFDHVCTTPGETRLRSTARPNEGYSDPAQCASDSSLSRSASLLATYVSRNPICRPLIPAAWISSNGDFSRSRMAGGASQSIRLRAKH